MTKLSVSLVLTFFFLFPAASLLEAAELDQNSEGIYYIVNDVNNDGEPSNVQYGIFKQENDRYQVVKKGPITPGQKLPANCFVCVDEDADFAVSLYRPRVMSTDGNAQVKDLIKQEWKALEKGALLNQGDEIKTPPGSVSELQIGKSAVKVYANTHIFLASMNSSEVRIRLLDGKILSAVNGFGGGASFGILTPQADFLAKGTSFLVDSAGPRLSVYEGKVEQTIQSSGKKFDVPKNSPDSAEAADFKKRAERDMALPESKQWIRPEEIHISGSSQDVIANYLDPSFKKDPKHPVTKTSTTVTHGLVEVRMLFRGKQVGDMKPVKAGETATAYFVCTGGLKVETTGTMAAAAESAESNEDSEPSSKIPDQPPSNS